MAATRTPYLARVSDLLVTRVVIAIQYFDRDRVSAEADGLSSYWMLVENKRGNYSFLKGIAPYSAGVVAEAGFEVVHVRLPRYIPLQAGFDAVAAHLKRAGRPLQAMCGMELRSPKPFSFTGFNQFNAGYRSY